MNSTHKVEVFRIEEIFPHTNADSLEILRPFGGYQCVVKKGEWKVGDLAAYVPPDNLVPLARAEFAWLGEVLGVGVAKRTPKVVDGKLYHRVTAIKLRKEPSLGLVISVRETNKEGDDLASTLGVIHYDPPEKRTNASGQVVKRPWWMSKFKPSIPVPVYDLESLRRFFNIFEEGEEVWVSEKIHGANARFVWDDSKKLVLSQDGFRIGPLAVRWGGVGRRGISIIPAEERGLWVGSRTQWRLKGDNDWWRVIEKYPSIVELLADFPGTILYGEVYGDVQDLRYGKDQGEVDFAAFDVRSAKGEYYSGAFLGNLLRAYDIPSVPLIETEPIPFNLEKIFTLAEGPSFVPGAHHLREGVVVRPVVERLDPRVGRVVMKVVSTSYLERQK